MKHHHKPQLQLLPNQFASLANFPYSLNNNSEITLWQHNYIVYLLHKTKVEIDVWPIKRVDATELISSLVRIKNQMRKALQTK